jgi:hypothetical protein
MSSFLPIDCVLEIDDDLAHTAQRVRPKLAPVSRIGPILIAYQLRMRSHVASVTITVRA